MAESQVVKDAREKLISAVPSAVETLELLLDSERDNVRLGAAREILDRGGLPARSDHHVEIEIGLDDEIEQLIRGVTRQRVGTTEAADFDIEDAIVIDEDAPAELPIGEQVARDAPLVAPFDKISGPAQAKAVTDELNLETEDAPAELRDAWWQANPPAPPV